MVDAAEEEHVVSLDAMDYHVRVSRVVISETIKERRVKWMWMKMTTRGVSFIAVELKGVYVQPIPFHNIYDK